MKIKDTLIEFDKPEIKFEPRDIWVGLYWTGNNAGTIRVYKFYFCLLPMFPIIFKLLIWKNYSKWEDEKKRINDLKRHVEEIESKFNNQ